MEADKSRATQRSHHLAAATPGPPVSLSTLPPDALLYSPIHSYSLPGHKWQRKGLGLALHPTPGFNLPSTTLLQGNPPKKARFSPACQKMDFNIHDYHFK